MRGVHRVECHRVAQRHAVGSLRNRAGAKESRALRFADFGAFGIQQVKTAFARIHLDAGILDSRIRGEDRRKRAHTRRPLIFVQHQALQRTHRFHRLRARKIAELVALLHIAQRGPLARDRFHGRLVSRVRHQPEIASQQRVGIFQRKALQVVARAAETAAREIAVIELVIAHAHMRVGRTETLLVARQQSAEIGGKREVLLFVDHVFHEVGRFQVRQRQFPRALHFVAHRLKNRVGRGRLSAQHYQRTQAGGSQQETLHFAPPLLFSMVVGSGSSGGRSLLLAFFSISISDTRIAGATAETGTLPDSAPQ